jgi:hypothetical protein
MKQHTKYGRLIKMLWFDIHINANTKARVRVGNLRGEYDGVCVYEVKMWRSPMLEVNEYRRACLKKIPDQEFLIEHDRRDGMCKDTRPGNKG